MTDALLGEHGVLYELCDNVERAASRAKTVDEMRPLCAVFHACLESHAQLEDQQLFPSLEPLMREQAAVLDSFRRDHQIIAVNLEDIPHIEDLEELRRKLSAVLGIIREHFRNEEHNLFGETEAALGDDALTQLGAQWASIRNVKLP
jgi:hemerythrin-like domain-containing protein